MRASSVLGGDYIKAESVKESGPQKLVIAEVGIVEFDPKAGKTRKDRRIELTFTDERKLTLNNGNTEALIAAYGDDTDEWPGKSLVIYHDPNVKFGNKKVGGVRVKVQSKPAVTGAVSTPEQTADAAPDPFTDQF